MKTKHKLKEFLIRNGLKFTFKHCSVLYKNLVSSDVYTNTVKQNTALLNNLKRLRIFE